MTSNTFKLDGKVQSAWARRPAGNCEKPLGMIATAIEKLDLQFRWVRTPKGGKS